MQVPIRANTSQKAMLFWWIFYCPFAANGTRCGRRLDINIINYFDKLEEEVEELN